MKSTRLFSLPTWRVVKLLTFTFLASFSVFSQAPPNQQNALNPTGNVGVGTTNPDSKLQVNGSMSIDSSLIVRDSAIFQKQARMKDRVIVEGEAVIQGKLTAKDNFKVLGTTRVEGPLKLLNLNNVQSDDTTLLFINADGKVKSGSVITLQNLIYGTLPASCFSGYQPIWHNAPSILWTGTSSCIAKVGINTDSPVANFDVEGDSYFSTHTGIGIAPDNRITLAIHSKPGVAGNADKIGLQVELVSPDLDAAHYGLKTIVQNDGVKAIGIFNQTTNADVFRVYGDGKIWATGINIKNYTLFPDYVFKTNYALLPFSELRKFIQTYHHLPNMPSAEQVQKDGLELDQLVVKQQEKIEELTLYVLDLEKRLNTLENKTTTQPE